MSDVNCSTRRVVVLAVVLAVGSATGCVGEKNSSRERRDTPTPAAADPVRPANPPEVFPVRNGPPAGKEVEAVPKVLFEVAVPALQTAYHTNELEADGRFRKKRGVVTVWEVIEVGRTRDGDAFVSTHGFGHNPAPTVYFYFRPGQEAALTRLRKGVQKPHLKVEGTCRGKMRDGINRGILGYEFRVEFDDCRIAD